jgi:hypothetical protein
MTRRWIVPSVAGLGFCLAACSSTGSTNGTATTERAPIPVSGGTTSVTVLPIPSDCKSGTVADNIAAGGTTAMCLVLGSVVDATYSFSGTLYGSWSTAPSIANPSVIVAQSSHLVGRTLKATYRAVGAGTTLVEALFLQRCAPGDKTPCTIPPQVATILQLTVVPAAAVPTGGTLPTASTAPTSSASVSAVLPMVVCPTTYGVTPTSTVPLPSTISESVPRDLITQLAVYTDQQTQARESPITTTRGCPTDAPGSRIVRWIRGR